MEMNDITTLIGQLGFPIFTAVYFMTRLEKHIQKSNELLTILIDREGK
jgi:hypothetical protein